MKWFLNMKIGAKLISSFIFVAIIAGIVGFIGITDILHIDAEDTVLYERMTVPIAQVSDIARSFQKVRVATRDIILVNDMSEIERIEALIQQERDIMNKNSDLFVKTMTSDRVKNAYNEFVETRKVYVPYMEQLIALARDNKDDEAFALLHGDMKKAAQAEEEAIARLVAIKVEDAKAKADSNTVTANNAVLMMVITIVVGAVIAIGLGLFITSIISKPVRKLATAANTLADGDVEVDVKAETKDEIGQLMAAFERMIQNIRDQAKAVERIADGDLTLTITEKSEKDILGKKLKELVEKNNEILNNINAASEQVASGAKQVSDSSIALSQGATEQASSIQELTASLEEISTQTKLNAQNASQANELADMARVNAQQGNSQMKDMLKAMDEINSSSTSISKIIKVIDEIAFQTNILALNAAVEAARAGQHGKGFAVVAEEVRNLAARSANAAKETTAMIEGSIQKVEDGTKIANHTAEALDKIVDGIARVANIVSDITQASNEQATAISQINQGIMQVSQVVQTNSATSEESAAASEELASQAELLKEQVSRFRLKSRRAVSPYKAYENYDSEVIEMKDRKRVSSESGGYRPRSIVLNEREFGKY